MAATYEVTAKSATGSVVVERFATPDQAKWWADAMRNDGLVVEVHRVEGGVRTLVREIGGAKHEDAVLTGRG